MVFRNVNLIKRYRSRGKKIFLTQLNVAKFIELFSGSLYSFCKLLLPQISTSCTAKPRSEILEILTELFFELFVKITAVNVKLLANFFCRTSCPHHKFDSFPIYCFRRSPHSLRTHVFKKIYTTHSHENAS